MRPVYRGPVPTRTTSRGGQQPQLSEEWGFFRKALVQRIGEYCSFCEVPLGASLAIEHIVSKSKHPSLEASWHNFLLACTNCNSTKGKVVDFDNLSEYYFPSDTTVNTFKVFTYYYDAVDGLAKVRPANAADTRATKTIELTKLNRAREMDPKESDRRVTNRTKTWMVATDLASALAACYAALGAAANNDRGVQLLKEQIRAAAVAHGFWSVWMTVFGATLFVDDATRNDLLCELFVSAFPGTNYPVGTHCPAVVPTKYANGLPR